jgi:ADP-ribose pyrophosphatase YjhB (NUDIX family)
MENGHLPRVRVAGICVENERILTVSHYKQGQEYWLLPGGGVSYGESMEEALKREFVEEVGIDVGVGDILFIFDSIDPGGDRHVINVCFECLRRDGNPEVGEDPRVSGFAFLSKEEIMSRDFFPPIQDLLGDVLTGNPGQIYRGRRWKE